MTCAARTRGIRRSRAPHTTTGAAAAATSSSGHDSNDNNRHNHNMQQAISESMYYRDLEENERIQLAEAISASVNPDPGTGSGAGPGPGTKETGATMDSKGSDDLDELQLANPFQGIFDPVVSSPGSIDTNQQTMERRQSTDRLDQYLEGLVDQTIIETNFCEDCEEDDKANIQNQKMIDVDQKDLHDGDQMMVDDSPEHTKRYRTHDGYRYHRLEKKEEPQPHIDFVVGRGRVYPNGYMNIPLNPSLQSRNVIFIDPSDAVHADVKQYVQEVDYSQFGITSQQDRNHDIRVRFIFDWSSFYCGAMQGMEDVARQLGRPFEILVPLSHDEPDVPPDVKRVFNNRIYIPTAEIGEYPLFDWTAGANGEFVSSVLGDRSIASFINPTRYIRIFVY